MSDIRRSTLSLPRDVLWAKADWSPDKEHRYALTWATAEPSSPLPVFVGMNPSGASETAADRTLLWNWQSARRKAEGFTMLNLLSFRCTWPWDLLQTDAPNGPENDDVLRRHLTEAPYVVACWGGPPRVPKEAEPDPVRRKVGTKKLQALHEERVDFVRQLLQDLDKTTLCLGVTGQGHPRHPSRLGYDVPLISFSS